MTADSFGLSAIGQISIAVKDVDRAIAFYRDVLGLKFLFQFPGMGFFDAGGVRLYLTIPEKQEFAGTSILYYRVSDILQAAQALEQRGVSFREKPHLVHQDARHELWLGTFNDSEGNPVALMSEIPKAQA
jgi:methylmalonyl-CoA/ethylmalonyl-CoA epimerase